MEKRVEWGNLYLDKCMENEDLKNEIRVLQEILRVYLPIIEDKSENSRSSK
jgi:hypothetical protein